MYFLIIIFRHVRGPSPYSYGTPPEYDSNFEKKNSKTLKFVVADLWNTSYDYNNTKSAGPPLIYEKDIHYFLEYSFKIHV